MPVEISAGAVIFRREGDETKYLLLHYAAGHWDFVKGNVEKTEEEQDTVVRETKEETGIEDLRFLEGFRETITYFFKRGGRTIRKEVIFFLAETKTSDVKLSYEHVGYDWLSHNEAVERLTFKNAKEVLRKAHEHLEKSQSR